MVRKIDLIKGWFFKWCHGDIPLEKIRQYGDLRKSSTWFSAAQVALGEADKYYLTASDFSYSEYQSFLNCKKEFLAIYA